MNILLINTNPVVSRLLSLCIRDRSIVLEEITEPEESQRDSYEFVFVDEASYTKKVEQLERYLSIRKKVFFTKENIHIEGFDFCIQKPFLPSEILEILESSYKGKKEEKQAGTKVLDKEEVEKIKTLLDLDETERNGNDKVLSEEARKIEAIKEQLTAQGLKIIAEKEIFDKTEAVGIKHDLTPFIEESKFLKQSKKKKVKNGASKKIKNKIAHKKDDLIVQAVEMAMRTLKKKERKRLLKGKAVQITIQIEGEV